MMNLRTIAISTALVLILAACGTEDGVAGDSFDLDATLAVSCGDSVFFFTTTDGTRQFVIDAPGLASRATASGTVEETYAFDAEGITITYRTGTDLAGLACNDAIGVLPVVAESLSPISGSLTLTASTNPERQNDPGQQFALVTLDITSLEFEGFGIVTPFEIEELPIGWLPG